jgi:hypothetical protein
MWAEDATHSPQYRLRTLALAVAAYVGGAAALSPQTLLNVLEKYAGEMLAFPLLLAIGLCIAAPFLRPRSPLSLMHEAILRNGLRLTIIIVVFGLGASAFTTFKLAIPELVPFYADPLFADADTWLHGGDPGLLLHEMIPAWAQYPLAYLYGPVWFVLWFGLATFVGVIDDAHLRYRYFWCMALSFLLLGTVLATALSSVGPIFYEHFYDESRFEELLTSVQNSAFGDHMQQASHYLLAAHGEHGNQFGAGISAMPSMHLAVATLNALMIGSLNRTIGLVAWAYVGLIQIGSVYLGWHYAVDGYVSIALVSVIWWSLGRRIALLMTPARTVTSAAV